MILTKSTKNQLLLFFVLVIGGFFASSAQEVAPFAPRLDGDNIEIRGDIIFVGNNILNRATEANPEQANTPYNGSNNNNSLWMEYIDIDSDPSTFSSSSAELNITDPSCSQVRYAGLYWAATYPNERSTDGSSQFNGTPRIEDWFNIKFQVPGGSYVDLTADTAADPAGQEDDIIYDGYDPVNINNSFKDSPYICYKNVTDLVRGNTNPNGEYTVANVRATKGRRRGSSSAGWVMVIIYENPNESGKFISTYDGYAGMSGSAGNVDVQVEDFRTLPSPFPVRARIGVAALEGDRGIRNDRFFLKADSNTNFTNLSTGQNPANNFFNSTITNNGNQVPTRTPYGTNTLGTDIDLFNLNNPSNSVLPNDESDATLRFTSTGDGYGAFLAAFAVEIIEPNIVLEKRVEDIAGNDITSGGVNLGQTLDYVLSFRNLGNDDAINYNIRDVLPVNTSYVSIDVSGAPGVTGVYDSPTNEINFSIPDNLVEIGDPAYTIRLRVEVASNCYDFVDACSDQIENLAYSTYQGDINSAVITDDPSVSDFDNCGFVTPGATNFLLDDLSACNFERTVQLCGANAILDAGDGFDTYEWYRDENGNQQIDTGVDTPLNDGDPDNDPSTLLVDDIGVYIVDKIIPDPCKGFIEIITVERFGSTQTNPIIDYFNNVNGDADPTNDIQGEIVTCSVDGDMMPKIFLCGTNDTQPMQVNITDAQSLVWERLDESAIGSGGCTAAPNDCSNKNPSCGWTEVETGNNYTADSEGKYRLVINYTNGCFSRFYFDVFQNNLDIDFNKRDIICTRDGRIRITNLGANYGYQLIDHANSSILIPFSANNGPVFDFGSGENGSYRVEVVQLDGAGDPIPGACIFSTDPIGIRDRDFQVDITTTDANCNDQGSIEIDVLNVRPDYTYVLRRSDGTLIDDETAQPDNTHTFNVNPGDYIIETSTQHGCTDSQNITVGRVPDPALSGVTTANIGCTAGTIELTRTGGQGNPDFLYAIWSKDGTDLHADIASIPADQYQVSPTFNFGWRDDDGDGADEYIPGEDGVYEFVIIDANNCSAISNPVTINDNGPTTIDSITETQPSCSGDNDGALTINVSGGVPPYEYSIDNGANYQSTPNFVNLSAATYNIRVLDDSGCDITQTYVLSEPFPMSASAGVSRDATCDPNGAEVRITNVVGGNGSYQYSFDGGATYGASTVAVLPPGDYTVVVSDGSCEFPMAVTVDDVPAEPTVTLTPEVSYLCDGSAVVTATPDITTYNYTYYLDGVINSPDPTSNVFPNVAPGTYTVSTNYTSSTPPTPSLLLSEDFGYGNTIPNPNTSGYFYENQQDDVTPSGAPIDNGRQVNDYEYAVTDSIARPFGAWLNPMDHTTGNRDTDGRYLVINIGAPSPGQIIYQKPINDIIHNQPIEVSIWLINLLRSGRNGVEPDLTIELRDPGSGAVVTSSNTGAVPENDIWNEYVLSLNPGANSSLDLVITTNESEINGNDVAIDDITVYQTPEVCELTVETPVTVEAARVFSANVTATSNASCNGLSDANITFEVENFDATAGFDYSLDGGTTWTNSTVSPVTTSAPIAAGTQRIDIRKADEHSCNTFVEETISEPNALVAGGSVTTAYTCANGGATITASVSGGTPNYEYQLEDGGGNVIGSFDFATNGNNTVFTGLAPDDYIVRVRDNNTCEDAIDTALTVADTRPITFDVDETKCYSGANDAAIEVDVTDGNGDYTFSINGGPWITPSPATATTHTFENLANGSYTINVRDGAGCVGTVQTVEIDEAITVSASAPPITACTTFTTVTISSSGGDGSFQYAIVPDGATPTMPDYDASTVRTISAAGDYDIYLRDPSGGPDRCTAFTEITITQIAPIAITATPTDVTCFGGSNGAISIVVDSGGNGPFRYSIDNGTTYVTGGNFPNLSAATYPVRVIDADGCETVPQDVDVVEPAQLMADTDISQAYTCTQLGEITVGGTTLSGGSGDYQFSINGGAWTGSTTTSHTFTDLTDGTYAIRIRDANATGCSINLPNEIIDPLPTEPTLTTSVDYNCDGSGNITVTPFDASYTYILDGALPGVSGAGANVFSNVSVGSHTITVDYGRDCTVDVTEIVADGNAFEASISASENLDCNGDASGTITIDADNYGTGGYEYSLNGAAFVGPFTAAEQLTGLNAQAHSIEVRDFDNAAASLPGCTVTLTRTLTEPTVLAVSAVVSPQITCSTGATITANGSGGTGPYVYQLEDDSANIIAGYDFATNGNNDVFSNITVAGDYIVRIQDVNTCETVSAAVTATAPDSIVFDVTPTDCYSGANDASLFVDVTGGNGGYQFRLNSGPWITPTPSTDTSYTFENLTDGSYDVEVRDQFGCPVAANTQTATINPQLTATVDVVDISSCATGSIAVNATGGDSNYAYAFVPTTTPVTAGDFVPSNNFAVTPGNDGDYDVYVWDNNAGTDHCEYMETVTVDPATPIVFTSTPTDPQCHDGTGSIEVNITSGENPYTIQIVDLDNGGASDQTDTGVIATTQSYFNLAPGNYTINVTDVNGCTETQTPVTIGNPDELTGTVVGVTPATCTGDPNDFGFRFDTYTTTLGAIEFSDDGGTTWTGDNSNPGVSDEFTGYNSGDIVYPSMRTVDGFGNTLCQTDLPQFIIPFPLDDLDITVSAVVVNCNELQVTVEGQEGTAPYEYTYSEDPANFDQLAPVHPWTNPPKVAGDPHTFTGLVPGRTYTFYVRDASGSPGCVRQSNVNVNDLITVPLEITTASEPSCAGASDGEITFTVTDNDAPFGPQFRWEVFDVSGGTPVSVADSGGNVAYSSPQDVVVGGLPAGNYFIDVTEIDSGGIDSCRGASENHDLIELQPITANLNSLRDISCNQPGLISIENITGGGGTFTYTVTGPGTFMTITNTSDNPVEIAASSPSGNYNVVITDQYGCSADLGDILMTLTANPTIDTMNVANCASPTSLTISATSTATQILYSIDGGTNYVDNGGVFNNLTAGTYNVSIIDSNGCTDTDTVVVHPILQADVSLTKLLDCTATPDAQITIDVTSGSTNYDYEITNGAGTVVSRTALPSDPYVFDASVAENYVITIYDNSTSGPECSRSFPIEVPAALVPSFTEVHADVSCNGGADGTITLTETTNGINPLTFSIAPSAGSFNAATKTFENLPIGTYTVTGTGTNGCTTDITGIVIDEPATISIPVPTVVEFGCTTANSQNDATITIDDASITGGSGTYVRYEFVNDQGTVATGDDVTVQNGTNTVYTETDTTGGTYIINAYDDNGCVGTTTATILPFVEISNPTVTIDSDVTCNPGDDAQISIGITLSPVTGTPSIEYSVTGTDNAYSVLNQTSNTFTALGIGNYEVTVTNTDTGCFVQTTFEIEDPNNFEITATTVDVECHGTDGSVSFTIDDPVNPYSNGFTWQIYNSQGTATLADDAIIVGAAGTSADVGPTTPFAIGAGEYRVEVTQDSDPSCVNNQTFTIAGPSDPITANTDVTEVTCAGNDGVIEITDVQGGWSGFTYFVAPASDPVPSFPGSYVSSPRFTGLAGAAAPGTDYQVWVADQNGCESRLADVTLVEPTPISANLQINQANCTNFEGEVEVSAPTGGQGSNYTYQLIKDGTPIRAPQNTRVFSGLDAGSYEVAITDQWTCSFTTSPAEIIFEPIVPLATVDKTIDCSATPGGQITITQTGGSGTFDYEVRYPGTLPTDPADDTSTAAASATFMGLTAVGDYIFTITDTDPDQACSTTITQQLDAAVQPVISVDTFTDVTCNGANDGTITVSATDNGVGPYTFSIVAATGGSATLPITATSSTNTTAIFTGLEGTSTGITYTIQVEGMNECTSTITQQIVQPNLIANVNATVTEFGCSAGNNPDNATISIDDAAITGGAGTYVRYEFINSTTATTVQDGPNSSYTETDVAGGNYTINVYDANGCIGSTTATIAPFIEISDAVVSTTQEAACTPLNNGIIEVGVTVDPSSATPNLEYVVTGINVTYSQTITSTNNPETFTGLEFGNYRVSITNTTTGCTIETVHTIDDPDTIEAVATKLTDEECLNDGVDDGSFQLDVNGYTGTYSYQVFDNNDNPVAGASFSGTGDTATALPPISGLPGGVYYIRVTATSAPSCDDDSNYFTINAPSDPITAVVSEEANVTCSNDQGRLFVDPTGGEGPYTIDLEDVTTTPTPVDSQSNVEAYIFEGLSAGNYHITVTDALGCVESYNIDLIRPDAIVANITSTPLACFDDNTATVTATIDPRTNPATPVYEYRLNRYDDLAGTTLLQTSAAQPGATFNGLATGFYSITVADEVSCSDETDIIEIANPTEVEALLIRTSPLTCTTGVEFELSATGGSGTYEYSTDDVNWNPMTGNSVNLPLSGMLAEGIYQYFVRDAVNTCASVLSNPIEEDAIEPLTLTVDESAAVINCNGESTAVIIADAEGGLGGYMYSLYTDASLSAASRIAGPKPGGQFGGLPVGTYYVHVTSDDCIVAPEQVIITEPDAISLIEANDFTDVTCNGANDGTITVELTGGVGPYQYAISPNLNKFDDENTFENLAPGDYRVIAQDNNGCFIEMEYTIAEPDVLDVTATALPEVCQGEENGSIELAISGGTAPYSTRLSSETNFVQDRTLITDLASGSYIVFIQDANGCEENVPVVIDPGVNLNATVETVYGCEDNIPSNYVNIVLEDESISDEVLYALDSTDPADMQLNPFFRDTMPGTHFIAISHANGCIVTHDFVTEGYEPLTITVEQSNINELTAIVAGGRENYTIYFGDVNNGSDNTYMINRTDTYVVTVVDENGCEATASLFIEFIDIDIPNFFSPNGDAENQFWKPRNDEGFPEILTIIFDRYGREVYRMGQGDRGWDGFYQQTELPTGDYWYIIKLNGENDDREFVGHFTLYR